VPKREIGTALKLQPKKNGYQLNKPVPTTNFFEGLKEVLDNEKNNIRVEKTSIYLYW